MIFGIFRISGHSMLPTLKPNDHVIASNLPYFLREPRIRDIVLFRYNDKILVKRISRLKNKKSFLAGDNKSDTLKIEPIEQKDILGKVLFTISAKG
mgnify:CR=1 FL=1